MAKNSSRIQRARFKQLREASSAILPQFLEKQRWFASKARAIDRADLVDGVWLDDRFLLAFARLAFREGEEETYSLLLKVAPDLEGTPALGSFSESGKDLQFGESSPERAAATALIDALCRGAELSSVGGGVLRSGDRETQRLEVTALRDQEVKPLGTEQSNTSIRVGEDFVFKLFRKLQNGENPELEVSRFLWRKTTFRAMPGLRGWQTMRFASGDESTVGILQDWVANEGDGWSYLLGSLPARTQEEELVLSQNMHRLGQITAEFHWALAGAEMEPGFAPEPVSESDVTAWLDSHRRRSHHMFEQLAQRKRDASDAVRDLWNVVDRGRDLLTEESKFSCSGDDGFQKIRVHGDFHLGQTLKTESDFVLFDFEGEPARSLEERRSKTSALKDVAGMLRSLEYAVEYAHRSESSARALPDEESPGKPLRTAFLSGYFTNTFERGAPFLPRSRSAVQSWLDFFELDKVLYELGYELNNRPDWLWIPLKGAARLIERRRR